MIDALRSNASAHTLSHEALSLGVDHPVFFCEQKPGRLYFPCWCRRRLLNALDRNWPLHGSQDALLVSFSFVRNRFVKSLLRHPQKAMPVRAEFGGIRMQFIAIKDFRDCFALVGRKGRNVNQRLNSILLRGRNYSSSVGVPDEDYRATCALDCAIQRASIVS
jgi:hypothetical protein